MKLEGIHHVTAITAEAQRNVDFYAGVLGLRLVKKSVNQDQTSVYHLFYADEDGLSGVRHHVLRVSRAPREAAPEPGWCTGSSGGSPARKRSTSGSGGWPTPATSRAGWMGALRFQDFEGLEHELAVVQTPDEPLIADHPEIPRELALQGFHAVRAYTDEPQRSRALLEETLGFEPQDESELRGARGAAAAASTSTIPRRPSGRSRAPARFTTSRGHRSPRTRRRGSGP